MKKNVFLFSISIVVTLIMKTYLLSLFFFLFFIFSLQGQLTPVYSKYYSYQDGLPDRTVYDIIKDSNGMMWASTASGLARFDGKQIKVFTNQPIPNLAKKINIKGAGKLSEDNFNNLVIQPYNAPDSLEFLNINTLEAYGISLNRNTSLEGNFVDLCRLKNGQIFILNKSRTHFLIYQWKGDRNFKLLQKLETQDSNTFKNDRFAVSNDGTIWIFNFSEKNIIKIKNGAQKIFPLKKQNQLSTLNFFRTTQIGNLFYSITNSKNLTLIRGKDNSVENFPTQHEFNLFWEDNHSNVILSSSSFNYSNKLLLINNKRDVIDLESIRETEPKISSVYGDDFTKSFHLGSFNGFYVFEFSLEKENIQSYLAQKLEGGRFGMVMRGFIEDDRNNVFANGEGKNWYQLNTNNNNFDTLQLRDENGKLLENVSCGGNLIFDGKYIWGVSCNGEKPGRIHRYHAETKTWKVWNLPVDAVFPRIIYPKSENEFWVLTLHRTKRDGDIFIFDKTNGVFTPFENWENQKSPFEKSEINDIIKDENEIFWIATTNGLVRFDPQKRAFKKFQINNYNNNIATLYQDNNNTMWVGTNGLGLLFFDRKKETFSKFELQPERNIQFQSNTIPPLPNNYIASIFQITNDEFLVSTWRGLALLNLKEKSTVHYFQKDGLSSDEFNRLSFYRDKKNNIFLGGINGFDVFKLEDLQEKKTHPKPRITRFFTYDEDQEKIKNQYHQLDFSSPLNIAPNSPFFGFDFMLPNYIESENNTFQTWLEGYEYGYNLPTKLPSVQYNRVPPGDYKLHIKAKDSRGNTSIEELVLPIHVQQVFYKTWWFLTLAALALIGVVTWFFKRRIDAIQRKEKYEKEKRANQRKFLELELKTLRLQLNPHFMFNALGAIQYYIKQNNSRLAINYLADFAKLMRLFLESSKKRYISLEEELELIKLYVELEQMRFDHKFEVKYLIDDSLNPSTTELPSLLLQPFVENAINHGLRHKEGKGNLLVQIKNDRLNDMIQYIIEDDGIGRDRAAIIKQQSLKKHKSRGTQIVQERLEAFKSSGELELEIKTEDANPSLNDCGTRVTVSILNTD